MKFRFQFFCAFQRDRNRRHVPSPDKKTSRLWSPKGGVTGCLGAPRPQSLDIQARMQILYGVNLEVINVGHTLDSRFST
jgi:hypothetical protein